MPWLLAGVLGFEPRECQSQSLVPYRLAIPHCLTPKYDNTEIEFCKAFFYKILQPGKTKTIGSQNFEKSYFTERKDKNKATANAVAFGWGTRIRT